MAMLRSAMCLVATLVALAAVPGRAAEPAGEVKRVAPSGYTFNRETLKHPRETEAKPIYGDPTRSKLIDGKKGPRDGKVIWRCKGWGGGRHLDIDFTFRQPVSLRKVVLVSLRRRAYAVQRVQVLGRTAEGEAILGDVAFKQGYHYPPKPGMPSAKWEPLTVQCEATTVTSARLRIHLMSYFGLAEVEFFGVPKAPPPAAKGAGYRVPTPTGRGLRVLAGDFNGDRQPDFLLENDRVAYIVDTRRGGVVNYALDKATGVNLVKPNEKGTWGGLFADRMYPGPGIKFFQQRYTGEIVKDAPEKVSVRVKGKGKGGQFEWITYEKTYTLKPDSVVLRADYRIHNAQDNVVAVDYGAWALNGMGTDKEPWRVFWADEGGPRERKTFKAIYVFEPRRGWLGLVTDSGSGIAMISEYRRLASFLFWTSGHNATIEFKMGRYPIPAGGHIRMTAWAAPFHGVGTPHGVSEAMVGSMDVPPKLETAPKSVRVRLKPNRPGVFKAILESRRLPAKAWTRQHEATVTGEKPVDFAANVSLARRGSYVLRVRGTEGGKDVFSMERPTTLGRASGAYVMAPECERSLPKTAQAKPGQVDYHSLDYETPHTKWARPWAGGKPRVLFLPRRRAGVREAVELGQRFEMDFHTSYLPRSMTSGCLYDLASYLGRLNAGILTKALRKTFEKESFDAYVIPGDLWKDLKPGTRKLILDKVKQGTGLVLLAPEHTPDELDEIVKPMRPKKRVRRIRGAWRKAADHFVTEGVPFEALPATLALPYRMGGETLATVGGSPLVAVGRLGKGRVAVASWVVAGLRRATYHQTHGGVGLLPNMLALGRDFTCEYDYWEYQMSLLARMVYWAAAKESGVRGGLEITDMKPDGSGMGVLRLRSTTKTTQPVEVTWTVRDRFSRQVSAGGRRGFLRGGSMETPLPFRNARLDGRVFLEVIARARGKTLWWGTATKRVTAPVRIESLDLAKRVWRRGEALSGHVTLAGDTRGAQVLVEGVDAHDRVFAAEWPRVEGKRLAFSLPLKGSLGLTGRVVARVTRAGPPLAEVRRPYVVYHVPDSTRMQVAFGWPWCSVEGQRRFLMKAYHRRLGELGANTIRLHGVSPFEWFEARSLGMATLKSRAGAGVGGKRPHRGVRTKLKGKWALLRRPCLSDPKIQKQIEEKNASLQGFEDAGTLYRGLGDELNSISYWDGCFSEHCRRRFRAWLKERYGSLDALNREWKTNHASWDKVVALTREEVKGRASFAPWVDHRLFNYWNWSRSFAAARRGLKRCDPAIRLGFSGTQETNPWNAYDWRQICDHVNAFAAYRGEQTVMRRCFRDNTFGMSWLGYKADADQMLHRALVSLLDGERGFSVYSGRFFINPDYTFPERAQWLRGALRSVDGGRAEVVINSRYDAGDVALHYSPATICVNFITGVDTIRKAETIGYRRLLEQQSADYDYLAYRELEAGKVASRDGRPYRALVLPVSAGVSDKECATVRRWVRDGGVLIAGLGAATYTEHGRPRGAGALDDVFGLRRGETEVVNEDLKAEVKGGAHGLDFGVFSMPVRYFETGLAPTTAKPAAWVTWKGSRRPVVFINRFGKGVAVYFAADLVSVYGEWGATRVMAKRAVPAKGMDRFTAGLLRLVGAEGRPVPLTEKGERLRCARVVCRRQGPMRLVAVIREVNETRNLDPGPHKVAMRLGRPWHVYELMTRKYAGRTDTYRDTFKANTHRVLALLPYEVKGLALDGPPSVKRGEEAALSARVLADAPRLAEHRLHVRVLGPDGKPRRGYPDLLVCRDGRAALRLPIALSDDPGEWKVVVTDAISNRSASARFTVGK